MLHDFEPKHGDFKVLTDYTFTLYTIVIKMKTNLTWKTKKIAHAKNTRTNFYLNKIVSILIDLNRFSTLKLVWARLGSIRPWHQQKERWLLAETIHLDSYLLNQLRTHCSCNFQAQMNSKPLVEWDICRTYPIMLQLDNPISLGNQRICSIWRTQKSLVTFVFKNKILVPKQVSNTLSMLSGKALASKNIQMDNINVTQVKKKH